MKFAGNLRDASVPRAGKVFLQRLNLVSGFANLTSNSIFECLDFPSLSTQTRNLRPWDTCSVSGLTVTGNHDMWFVIFNDGTQDISRRPVNWPTAALTTLPRLPLPQYGEKPRRIPDRLSWTSSTSRIPRTHTPTGVFARTCRSYVHISE